MIGFLSVAAILVVLTLLLLLLPLLRHQEQGGASRTAINASIFQDQLAELDRDFAAGSLTHDDYEQGRRELQRRLLEETSVETGALPKPTARRSALFVGVMVPVAAALLYFALGDVAALSLPQAVAPTHVSASDIEGMVTKLAARLEQNPGDPNGWVMLARSYKAMNRYDEAATAFARATALVDDDPQLLVDYAQSLAVAKGGILAGAPAELIQRALKLDPNHQNALFLDGAAAFERGDFAAAIVQWERLQKQFPTDSEDAEVLSNSIAKARAQLVVQKKQPSGERTARK